MSECKNCRSNNTYVYATRLSPVQYKNTVLRYRECKQCGYKFLTIGLELFYKSVGEEVKKADSDQLDLFL